MKEEIAKLIVQYETLIKMCESDERADFNTGNLEVYIKGKKEAYKRILQDLKEIYHAKTH